MSRYRHTDSERETKRFNLLRILSMRLKQEEDSDVSFWKQFKKLILITTLSVNVLLLIDVFVLPGSKVNDVISDINNIRTRRSNQSSVQIHTLGGAHWFIQSTGFEMPFTEITYSVSSIFGLQYDIYNVRYHQPVNRSTPSVFVGPVYAAISILFALFIQFHSYARKPKIEIHLTQYALILLGVELISFII